MSGATPHLTTMNRATASGDAPGLPALLRERLRGRPTPLWLFEDGLVLSAANLWAGARRWVALGRAAGLGAGDRVLLRAHPSPGFLAALVAGLSEQWTLALLPASGTGADAFPAFRPRMAAGFGDAPRGVAWDAAGAPQARAGWRAAARDFAPVPDARLLLRTSGSTADGKWVALSEENVMTVLRSHLPILGWTENTRLLSVLPWHHAFGLVLELFAATVSGASVIRSAPAPDAMRRALETFGTGQLLAVPALVRRWADDAGGVRDLQKFAGGIVGGAPVDRALAGVLASTRLRVGYGLTEASPGLSLGEPGEFSEGFLGRPLGCAARVAPDGELLFRGPNACLGVCEGGGIALLAPGRWQPTGDLAHMENGALRFVGRKAAGWKLDNGRWFHPSAFERAALSRFAALEDAVLLPDFAGRRFALAALVRENVPPPPLADLRPLLGPLGERLVSVLRVSPSDWPRLPKGDTDRRALARMVGACGGAAFSESLCP